MMNATELSEALNERLQQLEASNNESQKFEQLEKDDENRKLFELAIRIYCHRLGGDVYINSFENGYRDRYEFEEKEDWLLDLSGRMMFSFDPLTDDLSTIGTVDYSKFDWKVEIEPFGSDKEGIPCFTYLSADKELRQRQWQHPYEQQHRILMREALQKYEVSRPQSNLKSRVFDSNSQGVDSSIGEYALSNKLNRAETIFAQVLGVHIDEEHAAVLVELAAELMNVLPADWEVGSVESDGGMLIPYFYDTVRRASQWNHPFETQHRQMIVARRNDLIQQKKAKRNKEDYTRALSTLVKERTRQAESLLREEMIAEGQLLPDEYSYQEGSWNGDVLHEEKDDDDDVDEVEHKSAEPIDQKVYIVKTPEVETIVVAEVPPALDVAEQSASPLLEVTANLSMDDVMQPLAQLDEEHSVQMEELSQAEDDNSVFTASEQTLAPHEEPPSASNLVDAVVIDATVLPDTSDETTSAEIVKPSVDVTSSPTLEEPEVYTDDFSEATAEIEAANASPAVVIDATISLDRAELTTEAIIPVKDEPSVDSRAPVVDEQEAHKESFSEATAEVEAVSALPAVLPSDPVDDKKVAVVDSLAVKSEKNDDSFLSYADDFSEGEQPVQPVVVDVSLDTSVEVPAPIADSKVIEEDNQNHLVGDEVKNIIDDDNSNGYEDDFSAGQIEAEQQQDVIPIFVTVEETIKDKADTIVEGLQVADIATHEIDTEGKSASIEGSQVEESVPIRLETTSLAGSDANASYEDEFLAASDEESVKAEAARINDTISEVVLMSAPDVVDAVAADGDNNVVESTISLDVVQPELQAVNVAESVHNGDFTSEPVLKEEEEKNSEPSYDDDFSLVESLHSTESINKAEKESIATETPTAESEEPAAIVAAADVSEEQVFSVNRVEANNNQLEEELSLKLDDSTRAVALTIRKIVAKALKNVELFGKNDPYITLVWNNDSWQMKTPIIDGGGSDVEWSFDDSYQFETTEAELETGKLVVQTFDANRLRGDTFIGSGELTLSIQSNSVMRSKREGDEMGCEHLEATVQLLDKKGKNSGEVIIYMDSIILKIPKAEVESAIGMTEEAIAVIEESVEATVAMIDESDVSVAANLSDEGSANYGDDSFIDENSAVMETEVCKMDSESDGRSNEENVEKVPVVNFVHQFVEDEESVAASVDSHPLWNNILRDVAADKDPEVDLNETDFDVFSFDAKRVENLHIESAVTAELDPQEEEKLGSSDFNEVELPSIPPAVVEPIIRVNTVFESDASDVLLAKPFPTQQVNDVKPLLPADIASRPIKVTAKHMNLLNSRSVPRMPSVDAVMLPQETSPVIMKSEKNRSIAALKGPRTGINWFSLGSYDSHAEAMKGRKTMKSIVIADSNGTIQIDPRINFHEINDDEVSNGNNNVDMHERKEEDSNLMIIGRMSSNADRGVVKMVLRRDLSKMQWSVETDDKEVKRIVQRHRRKRGIDGSSENIIPVKPLKRSVVAQNGNGNVVSLSPIAQSNAVPTGRDSPETKGFGEFANLMAQSKQKNLSKKVNIIKENIEKFRSSEKMVEVEVTPPPRAKVSDIDMRLLKIKRLLIMSSTVPVASKASIQNIKLPPLS